jgi:hypothetical protein
MRAHLRFSEAKGSSLIGATTPFQVTLHFQFACHAVRSVMLPDEPARLLLVRTRLPQETRETREPINRPPSDRAFSFLAGLEL